MTYRTAAISMTLSDLQGYSPIGGYCKSFQMGFWYSCAAVDEILTDVTHRAVPLR